MTEDADLTCKQLADHDKRLAVVETKVEAMQGDITEIKERVAENSTLIQGVASDVKSVLAQGRTVAWIFGAVGSVAGLWLAYLSVDVP